MEIFMSIACITGASSGIGRAFAIHLSKMGYNLILISRNTYKLKKLASNLNTKCKIIYCDLANENSCHNLANQLKKYNIDILINNAGFGDLGMFDKTDLLKDLDMIQVNIKAMHILTKELLPEFIKRDKGYIMNVASSAGLLPGGPHMATYYATKAYVTSLTCSIYQELQEQPMCHPHIQPQIAHLSVPQWTKNHSIQHKKSSVHICALCPGPVHTNFDKAANVKFSINGISASYCAAYGLKKMFQKKLIIIPTWYMKAAVWAIHKIPRKMALAITAQQQHKKYLQQ